MSTKTNTTGKATVTGSTVRPGLRVGKQVVAVQFGVWGPQEVAVRAYSGGSRGGAPYVAVSVGTCPRREVARLARPGPKRVGPRPYAAPSPARPACPQPARLVHSRTAARRRPHRRGHARAMTPTPPPVPTTVPASSSWTPTSPTGHRWAMPATTTPLCTSCPPRRRSSTTSSTPTARAATPLTAPLAPIDATGKLGPPCYWVTINGMRPAQR